MNVCVCIMGVCTYRFSVIDAQRSGGISYVHTRCQQAVMGCSLCASVRVCEGGTLVLGVRESIWLLQADGLVDVSSCRSCSE